MFNNFNVSLVLRRVLTVINLITLSYLVSLTIFSNPYSHRIPAHDSSMFQYFGYAMSQGDRLYVDIFDHKGPIIFMINFFGQILTTDSIDGIWIFEWVSIFIFFFWVYRISRFWNNRILSYVPVLFFSIALPSLLEGGNLTEEFALPFMAYSIYVFVKYFIDEEKVKTYEVVFIGLSVAVSFLLRPNLIGLWIAYCGFIFFNLLFVKKFDKLIHFVLAFLCGILLLVSPIIVYFLINHSLSEAYFQTWTFNLMYLNGNGINRLKSLMVLLGIMNNYGFLFIFSLFVGAMILRWKQISGEKQLLYIVSLVALIISGILTFISGRTYQHYLIALLPVLIIPLASLTSLVTPYLTHKMKSVIVVLLVLVSLSVPTYNNYVIAMSINTTEIREEGKLSETERNIKKYATDKNKLTEISDWVKEHSKLTDRIYSHRLAGNIYLESNRLSSIKYFNLPAVNLNLFPEIGEDFLQDFLNSNTQIVVLSEQFANGEKDHHNKLFYQYVLDHFTEGYRENGLVGFMKN